MQTSACGTPLWVPQALGVADSVLQVHDKLSVRSPKRTVTYDLSAVPFCTFDYRRFCEGLLGQARARFLRAAVTGMEEDAVLTSEGRFTAPVIVDCSGWRGALVNDGVPTSPGRGHFSFGLETRTDLSDKGLSFWLDGSLIPRGLGWIFPVGKGSLIGLGSYVGLSKLKPALERFLHDRGAVATTYHGTYFRTALPPHRGAALRSGRRRRSVPAPHRRGHSPAPYFGVECGRIVQKIFDGRLGLLEGLERYRVLVDAPPPRLPRPARGAVGGRARAHGLVRCSHGLAGRQPVCPAGGPATAGSVASIPTLRSSRETSALDGERL